MFWIHNENSVNNRIVLAIAEHCLHSIKVFSASHDPTSE